MLFYFFVHSTFTILAVVAYLYTHEVIFYFFAWFSVIFYRRFIKKIGAAFKWVKCYVCVFLLLPSFFSKSHQKSPKFRNFLGELYVERKRIETALEAYKVCKIFENVHFLKLQESGKNPAYIRFVFDIIDEISPMPPLPDFIVIPVDVVWALVLFSSSSMWSDKMLLFL